MRSTPEQERYHLLDLLRFCAAVTVVVFHYHYFFKVPELLSRTVTSRAEQPFYPLLEPIYEYGFKAVPLFWALSGFIFFAYYAAPVRAGSVSAKRFFILRFSRLYPLHFATLLLVAALQLANMAAFGEFHIYFQNDLKHFVLNLFLASKWGLQDGSSFNKPIWSVSVEVLAYAAFFVFALRWRGEWRSLLAVVLISGMVWQTGNVIGEVMFFFFLGGLMVMVHAGLRALPEPRRAQAMAALCAANFGWLAAVVITPDLLGHDLVISLCFPVLILGLALAQTLWPQLGRHAGRLGDLTYASYLLHIPCMLAVMFVVRAMGWQFDPQQPAMLLCFVAAVLVLSQLCFLYFERPAQNMLRRHFLHRDQKKARALGPGQVQQGGDAIAPAPGESQPASL